MKEIFSTSAAFAALKEDGSVVTWGVSGYGGDSTKVTDDLSSGVIEVFSSGRAFAALKEDGSVVTWGRWGGGELYRGMLPLGAGLSCQKVRSRNGWKRCD